MADNLEETRDTQIEVEDTDADTRDVERTEQSDYSRILETLDSMREEMNRMNGAIQNIRAQQAVSIDSGVVIQDDTEPDSIDEIPEYSSLDFTIR